ncbi:competence/damage-inducible protein A [Maribacter stanieri]|uniref:competence/damage-inducible protein A n=1 Tax=Maribacter stanieri TaxID=440514 RepID=UPI00249469B9|nr:competence/damage-inducible protein A [Maribacter stanieri]|tara:strand:- start:18280 stop:19530 length:1251 start_codon:yes stop_codon:yes gene_type:complete
MLAEIITIGDEILIGQVIDTNSAFIAKELNKIGVSVYQITSIQDERIHLLNAFKEASERVDVVLITGGLGPTKDDITKHTLCEYFNDELVENAEVLAHVEELFAKYINNTPISDINRMQALVPSKAEVLHNANGTAPGMLIRQGEVTFVSMPGVPFEMKHLMKESVIPKLAAYYKRPHIIHKTIVTYGMGESAIAKRIETWEDELPSNIKLAYLPNLGKVRLRLSAKGSNYDELASAMEAESEKLYPLINDIVFGLEDDESLEEIVAKLLTSKNLTLSTAESFTGGKIAERITSVPGASSYFKGSVVSYATEAKINVLKVPEELVEKYSVVSAEVATAMAKGARELMKTDFAIATTGNAGPTKGDSNAEVGTVFIAIEGTTSHFVQEFQMGSTRERVVEKSVNKAFELLQKEILKM